MSLINFRFNSKALKMPMETNIVMSNKTDSSKKNGFKVLYLLHGMGGDCSTCLRNTSLERYVNENGSNLAVIMPNAHRSFYTNMVDGADYWKYISEEIPEIVEEHFNISPKRENCGVAGISMGGYGAIKLGLIFPQRFRFAAAISGALDAERFASKQIGTPDEEYIKYIFGSLDKIPHSENDLFHLADKFDSRYKNKLQLYQCCGMEDFLYQDNLRFYNYIKSLNFNISYYENSGSHTWAFWDKAIEDLLKWIASLDVRKTV